MVDSLRLHWWCSVPIGGTIAVLGLVGNVMSFIIWRQIKKCMHGNKSTATYFMSLALCDIALLVSFVLQDVISTNSPHLKETYAYAALYSWLFFPLFFYALVSSIWMLVGVTVNRFLMIRFPTKVNVFYSHSRCILGILGILTFAFIVNLPHFFTYHVVENDGKHSLQFTRYGASEGSVNYEFWVHCIVLVLGPWITVAILNGLIICHMRIYIKKFNSNSMIKSKQSLSKHEKREHQMTSMLLVTTTTFLVLLLWQCVTQCFWMLKFNKDIDHKSWMMVDKSFALAKLGVVINSSINWCLYCITSSMFRKEASKLLCVHTRKTKNLNTSSTTSMTKSQITKISENTDVDNTRL